MHQQHHHGWNFPVGGPATQIRAHAIADSRVTSSVPKTCSYGFWPNELLYKKSLKLGMRIELLFTDHLQIPVVILRQQHVQLPYLSVLLE